MQFSVEYGLKGTCWESILKYMLKVTKSHLHRLVVVLDNYTLFCEMSAQVNNCVTKPARWFCDSLQKVSEHREGTLMSPLIHLYSFTEN